MRKVTCLDCKKGFATCYQMDIHNCFGTDCNSTPRLRGIYEYWRWKRDVTSRKEGIDFKLTGSEMITLFDEAGIDPEDIGKGSNKYQLARYNDSGDYQVGNCRFITQRENIHEKDVSKYQQTRVKTGLNNSVRVNGKYYMSAVDAANDNRFSFLCRLITANKKAGNKDFTYHAPKANRKFHVEIL